MNLKKLAEELGLEEDEYMSMIELFFESGGADLQKLEAAVAAGDAGRGHEASHSLKGSAGSLGLTDIYTLISTIDDKLRRGDLAGVATLIAGVRTVFDRLRAAAHTSPKTRPRGDS
jgi:HPt (histidine-containing phosphotransfer) domain-containing protein